MLDGFIKHIILLLIASFVIVSCGTAKSVKYTHKALASEGCQVSYSVALQDSQPTIVVSVKSDRLIFGDSPTLLLRNFEGEILKLEGQSLQSRTETSGFVVNNIIVPVSELNAIAQFPVDIDAIPFFESGISKVRLSTIPITHEKNFSKDKIGMYLYKGLIKAQTSANSF